MTTPPIGLHVGRYLRWQRLLRVHVPRLGDGPCRPGLLFAQRQPSLEACIEAMRTHCPRWCQRGSWLRWWGRACWADRRALALAPWPSTDARRIAEIHAWADRVCPTSEGTWRPT